MIKIIKWLIFKFKILFFFLIVKYKRIKHILDAVFYKNDDAVDPFVFKVRLWLLYAVWILSLVVVWYTCPDEHPMKKWSK